jgi:hypothetical protein
VFKAIHEGDPDPKLLAYQYLQVLPQIAQGEANKVWIIPSEVTNALSTLGGALGAATGSGGGGGGQSGATEAAPERPDRPSGPAIPPPD